MKPSAAPFMSRAVLLSYPLSARRLAAALALDPVPPHWPAAFLEDQIRHMAAGNYGSELSDHAAVATARMERALAAVSDHPAMHA